MDIDTDVVVLCELRDACEDLFTGAFIAAAEIFIIITTDEDGEFLFLFYLLCFWATAFKVGVADLCSSLENFRAGDCADARVICEAAGDGGSGESELICDGLLIDF